MEYERITMLDPMYRACPQWAVQVCEIKALIKYAAEHGLDHEGNLLRPLMLKVEQLKPPESDSQPTALEDAKRQTSVDAETVILYARLSQLTAPVNGRTLMETEEKFKRAVFPLHVWTLLILAIVILNEVLKLWFADMEQPEEGALLHLIEWRGYILDVCSPFLWGALGSCIWLLKRLSDIAEGRCFDRAISRGWTTRILLGGVLGGIIQYLYDPQVFVTGTFKLGASALGFLTGVGVKVVYGAIEKSIEILTQKLNLDQKKENKDSAAVVRDFLTSQLGKVDMDKEPDKHGLLLGLLAEVNDAKTS